MTSGPVGNRHFFALPGPGPGIRETRPSYCASRSKFVDGRAKPGQSGLDSSGAWARGPCYPRRGKGQGTAMAKSKNFPVFDCDSHVVEPPAVWDEYVPARSRAWVKTQFCFHTDSDLLYINGRVVPAARERSNAAEVGWARWDKKEVGRLTPGHRGLAGEVRAPARLPRPAGAASGHGRAGHRPSDAVPHVVRPARAGARAPRPRRCWPRPTTTGCSTTARPTGGGCFRARSCPCRASRPRSRSCGGSPSSASRRRRCGPASGTGAIPPWPSSIRCGASSRRPGRCWRCTPSPPARR